MIDRFLGGIPVDFGEDPVGSRVEGDLFRVKNEEEGITTRDRSWDTRVEVES